MINMDTESFSVIEVQNSTLFIKEGIETLQLDDLRNDLENATSLEEVTTIVFPSTLREVAPSKVPLVDYNVIARRLKHIQTYLLRLQSIDMSTCMNFTEIDVNTFSAFPNFKEIKLPSTLREVQVAAFCGCKKLEKIDLGPNIEQIEDSAFRECSELREVTLGPKVTFIPTEAFRDCVKLETVRQLQNVRDIDTGAFDNCDSLVNLDLGGNLKFIRNGAFMYCRSLRDLSFLTNVEIIDPNAFMCANVKEVTFGQNLKCIGGVAFKDCVNLEKVKFGAKLRIVDSEAFAGCKALREAVLPNDFSFETYAQITGSVPANIEFLFREEIWTKSKLDGLMDLEHNLRERPQDSVVDYFNFKFSDELLLQQPDSGFGDYSIEETSLF